jgi:hypothetical protein
METSNLPDPFRLVIFGVGVMITVVTMKTVLLASCGVVWDRELNKSGVVDGTVDVIEDEVADVLEV